MNLLREYISKEIKNLLKEEKDDTIDKIKEIFESDYDLAMMLAESQGYDGQQIFDELLRTPFIVNKGSDREFEFQITDYFYNSERHFLQAKVLFICNEYFKFSFEGQTWRDTYINVGGKASVSLNDMASVFFGYLQGRFPYMAITINKVEVQK